jgi:putative ABC transport system permease protein
MFGANQLEMIYLGARDLSRYKLRSGLTMLGIVFGVAAVISMLAIGEGSKVEALSRIQKLGINNIAVWSSKPPEETRASSQGQTRVNTYGITFDDLQLIKETVPMVRRVVAGRDVRQDVIFQRRKMTTRVLGCEPEYVDVLNFHPREGRFITPLDMERRSEVAVITQGARRELFPLDDPMGQWVRVGGKLFQIIGIMEPRGESSTEFAPADLDRDIYIPRTTALSLFGTRSSRRTSGSREDIQLELDEIIIEVRESDDVPEIAKVITAVFEQNHEKRDYVVKVPLDLLLQARAQERIWNIVMGSIAGVSLLVGGIGIMNIMLASVTERTREIGIRRALGAKRRDIVTQFLIETIVLSLVGGVSGIILGAGSARLVNYYAHYATIVTASSIVLSFGISATVGIVFGIYPAWKAAYMDPIEALRHE